MTRPRTRGAKKAALIRSVKRDVAAGHRVTLITLSVKDMEEFAGHFTYDELKLLRFDVPGLIFARRSS